MNVYLETIGCRLNEAEVQSWARGFHRAGHLVVDSPARAHVIVLNTCAVTGEAARKSRQLIRRMSRCNPNAPLVVAGCFAELEPAATGELRGVDLVLGNRQKDRLVDAVLEHAAGRSRRTFPRPRPAVAAAFASAPEAERDRAGHDSDRIALFTPSRARAFVKVQDGCRHRCTFCIVTVARGAERSRPPAEIVDEINDLHQRGHQEVVLTGVHLGGYGGDLGGLEAGTGGGLAALVRTTLRHTSIPRLRLSSLEPWDLPPDFFELWADHRLMPHLHLPLQSGSDRVLRAMGRRTTIDAFRRLVSTARSSIEGLTVTTDIIAGFPGETDDDWRCGLDVLEEIGFGHIHAFTYSPRTGTAAASRRDQVPAETKRSRARELARLHTRLKRDHLRGFVGGTRSVLWETMEEGPADRGPEREMGGPSKGAGAPPRPRVTWRGYTDNYLRVEACSTRRELRGTIARACLVEETGDRLRAEIVDDASSRIVVPSRRDTNRDGAGPDRSTTPGGTAPA